MISHIATSIFNFFLHGTHSEVPATENTSIAITATDLTINKLFETAIKSFEESIEENTEKNLNEVKLFIKTIDKSNFTYIQPINSKNDYNHKIRLNNIKSCNLVRNVLVNLERLYRKHEHLHIQKNSEQTPSKGLSVSKFISDQLSYITQNYKLNNATNVFVSNYNYIKYLKRKLLPLQQSLSISECQIQNPALIGNVRELLTSLLGDIQSADSLENAISNILNSTSSNRSLFTQEKDWQLTISGLLNSVSKLGSVERNRVAALETCVQFFALAFIFIKIKKGCSCNLPSEELLFKELVVYIQNMLVSIYSSLISKLEEKEDDHFLEKAKLIFDFFNKMKAEDEFVDKYIDIDLVNYCLEKIVKLDDDNKSLLLKVLPLNCKAFDRAASSLKKDVNVLATTIISFFEQSRVNENLDIEKINIFLGDINHYFAFLSLPTASDTMSTGYLEAISSIFQAFAKALKPLFQGDDDQFEGLFEKFNKLFQPYNNIEAIVKAVVQEDGDLLHYVNVSLKQNPDIVLEALSSCPEILDIVPTSLSLNKDFLLAAIKKQPKVFQSINKQLYEDDDFLSKVDTILLTVGENYVDVVTFREQFIKPKLKVNELISASELFRQA